MSQRLQRFWGRINRKGHSLKGIVAKFFLWGVAALVVGAIGIVLFSPIFEVREVRIVRSDPRIDIERVQRLLRPVFKRHMMFLSSQEVLPLLKNGLPPSKDRPAEAGILDLLTVEVEKQYPDSLRVMLTLDPLIARLEIVPNEQDKAVASTGSTLADYMTDKGVYVAYSPDQAGSGTNLIPVIRVVDWSSKPGPFTVLFDEQFLKTMDGAEKALAEQFGQQVNVRTAFLRAREFHLKTPEYALWFDMRSPLETQLLRYRLFLQTLGKTAAKQYVDLRLTDRVVYK